LYEAGQEIVRLGTAVALFMPGQALLEAVEEFP
jgi:hypothetical protein